MKNIETGAISPWLQILWDQRGSDLLLAGGSAPRIRVDGRLRPLEGAPILSGTEIHNLVVTLLDPAQIEIFEEHQDVDFSFLGRTRPGSGPAPSPSAARPRWPFG